MIVTIVTFFIILTVLIFVHEFGHFIVARIIGVEVEEFGFGLPPRIWGKKAGKTIYSVNWLPIGGFVRLKGEDEEDREQAAHLDTRKAKTYFWGRSRLERSAILLAGVTMNFLLAIGIMTFLLVVQGEPKDTNRVHVDMVQPGSPAEKAGIRVGDVITSVEYQTGTVFAEGKSGITPEPKLTTTAITGADQLIKLTERLRGQPIVLRILRNSERTQAVLIPRQTYPTGQGPMGVAISSVELTTYTWAEAPPRAVVVTFTRAWDMIASLAALLYRAVTLQPIQADIAGPVGIAEVTGQAVRFGFYAVLEFASILSLNLAILNVLPFPALDGGRLAFVFLEKIFGKRLKPAFERSVHQVGMLILLALLLLVSVHDVFRLLHGG
ncbi:site-2 protease family protein [Patescibacteria group bacterium]|nr:site-2 protease family protein [Patescibacteria group bacterium]